MSDFVFYLGTHQPAWLWSDRIPADIPMFVSHRRLDGGPAGPRRSRYPTKLRAAAIDSGGFTELQMFGRWVTDPEDYVTAIHRYDTEIGHLDWAAPMDWMCEPAIINGGTFKGKVFVGTGLSVLEHQRRTIENLITLERIWAEREYDADSPFMPAVQGDDEAAYRRCWDMYGEAGVNLADYPVVGVGSVCRRESTDEIADIMHMLSDLGGPGDRQLHGFGVKTAGLKKYAGVLASSDSLAWSDCARKEGQPLPECVGGTHINCANCPRYALAWRDRALAALDSPMPTAHQLSLFDLIGAQS